MVVTDVYGIAHPINFFRPERLLVTVDVRIRALAGYTAATGVAIKQAVADYVNGVAIGGGASGSVEWGDAISAVNGVPGNATFKIAALTLSVPAGSGTPDVPLTFKQAAAATPDSVLLTVT